MPKVPIVSGQEAVRALQRLGFHLDRQRGSHAGVDALSNYSLK